MWSSPRRRQVVISSGLRSAFSPISRRLWASSDSGMPKRRIEKKAKAPVSPSRSRTGSESSAGPHSAFSSRGGPGSTITTCSPAGTTRPGAVPAGSSAMEPSGTIACLRLASCSGPGSNFIRAAKRSTIAAIFFSIPSSRTISRPANRPTTSAVRSSAVGPRPPVVTTSRTPWSRRNASAASMSSGRSPTTWMCATSTPILASCSETQGPLRSVIVALSTSVPVTTMPARTLTGRHSVRAAQPSKRSSALPGASFEELSTE